MSRSQVGRDWLTAYELHAGKPYRRQLVEFGERVYFMPSRPGARWAFIGIRDRSDEMLIMTPSGAQNEECAETPRVETMRFEVPHDVEGYDVESEPGNGRLQLMHCPHTGQSRCQGQQQTGCYIWRYNVQKYSYSMDCLGCTTVMMGATARTLKNVARG